MYLLLLIIHFRHDKLPPRLTLEGLANLAKAAVKYDCVEAISRATTRWFDRLLASGLEAKDTWSAVECAYTLDEPIFFARLTEKWVLEQPLGAAKVPVVEPGATTGTLAITLYQRVLAQVAVFRADLDLLIEPCSVAFTKDARYVTHHCRTSDHTDHPMSRHYIDYAPGMLPDDNEDGKVLGSVCHVDDMAGTTFLGALREEALWPPLVR